MSAQKPKTEIRKRRATDEKSNEKKGTVTKSAEEAKPETVTKSSKRHAKRTLAIIKSAGLEGAGINSNVAKIFENYQREKKREMVFFAVFLLLFNVNAMIQRDVSEGHNYAGLKASPE